MSSLIKHKTAEDIVQRPVQVSILYGRPGCGKSRAARILARDAGRVWVCPIGNQLWGDGYDNHEAAIFDDFGGKRSKISLDSLLQLIDCYSTDLQVKGSFTLFNPSEIYITTNFHPSEWYEWEDRQPQYLALRRRITAVYSWVGWNEGDAFAEPRCFRPGSISWANWWNYRPGQLVDAPVVQYDGYRVLPDLIDPYDLL